MSCWVWGLIVAVVLYIGCCIWSRRLKGWWPVGSPGGTPGSWEICAERVGDAGHPVASNRAFFKPLPGGRQARQAPGDLARLQTRGMPILRSTDDVLKWLNIDLRTFIAFADPTDRIRPGKTNYIEWTVPKKRGGVRIICSPKPRLKTIQTQIKEAILDRAPIHSAAHGFVRDRSIVTNAAPHVGKPLIVNLDLKDFFNSVRYPRVVGVFRWLGYSLEVSRCLALLCTYRPNLSPVAKMSETAAPVDYVCRHFRHAVQGAPTSPMLANLAAHRLDLRMSGLAKRFDCTYTRYADDLTFSGDEPFKRGMIRFLPLVKQIVRAEGFRLNYRKMRFMRPGQRQEVTGVVVNEKPNARREDYERLKAIIHNARKVGSLESQNRDSHKDFRSHLLGRIGHIARLNPERGQRLLDAIRDVR